MTSLPSAHPCRPPRTRALVVVGAALAAAGVTAGVGAALASVAHDACVAAVGPVPARPEDVLTGLVAGAGALLCLWWGTGVVLSLCAGLPGAVGSVAWRLSARITPTVVRRVSAAVLGGTLVATGAVPALAAAPLEGLSGSAGTARAAGGTSVSATRTPTTPTTPTTDPAEGFSPDLLPQPPPSERPAGPSAPPASTTPYGDAVTSPDLGVLAPRAPRSPVETAQPSPTPPSSPSSPSSAVAAATPVTRTTEPTPARASGPPAGLRTVTVTAGDTLWALAAAELGAPADVVSVTRAWHRWFAGNRRVVGPDPDLIHPGQVLVAPPPDAGRR